VVDLLVARKAPVERVQLDETSWVDVVRGFLPEPDALFQQLQDEMPWTQGSAIREGRRVLDPRLVAGISSRNTVRFPALHQSRLVLEARYRVRFSGVALTLYRNGRDGMGFHRDDEMRYLERTIITGLCLGADRPLALKEARGSGRQLVELGHGDLYVMGGRCQADWLHGIPKLEEAGPRISCVWRWTSRTGPPSSSPTHFIPDAPNRRRGR